MEGKKIKLLFETLVCVNSLLDYSKKTMGCVRRNDNEVGISKNIFLPQRTQR
jgi:hypothetical protein